MSEKLRKFLADDASDVYFEAMKLMKLDSNNDPVDSPYQSHYKARELICKLLKKIDEHIGEKNVLEKSEFSKLSTVLNLCLGVNHLETEELSKGNQLLEKCKNMADENSLIGLKQEVLNQIGILSFQQGDIELSLKYLEQAKELYKNQNNSPIPWMPDDFFTIEAYQSNEKNLELVKKRNDNFENNYTHTLYYLAQVCGKLGRNCDSASYCAETLSRQLDRHTYNPQDWSMNAATLSQYYTSVSDFKKARNCLAAAELILKELCECPKNLNVIVGEEDDQEEVNSKEKNSQKWADLYRCWSKYCISLLDMSREHAYSLLENKKAEIASDIVNSSTNEHVFNLMLDKYENQITAKVVLLFDEAREVFLKGQEWLSKAKEFYKLDGHCCDYIEIIKDHSCLFKLLAFWEGDISRQCCMHKRRADMLDALLSQLNSQYYLFQCCQLSFELGEIYSSILDLKVTLLETKDPSSQVSIHAGNKINSLAYKSIDAFKRYLSYLKNSHQDALSAFNESDERPALLAHFYIARMHSKLITGDQEQQLTNNANSLHHYTFIVNYCDKHPSGAEKVAIEREACKEMVVLLPQKMQRIKQLINS